MWLIYANCAPKVLHLGADLPLINHFGLTSQPQRPRWIEVLSRPKATKTKSNWCVARGGQL